MSKAVSRSLALICVFVGIACAWKACGPTKSVDIGSFQRPFEPTEHRDFSARTGRDTQTASSQIDVTDEDDGSEPSGSTRGAARWGDDPRSVHDAETAIRLTIWDGRRLPTGLQSPVRIDGLSDGQQVLLVTTIETRGAYFDTLAVADTPLPHAIRVENGSAVGSWSTSFLTRVSPDSRLRLTALVFPAEYDFNPQRTFSGVVTRLDLEDVLIVDGTQFSSKEGSVSVRNLSGMHASFRHPIRVQIHNQSTTDAVYYLLIVADTKQLDGPEGSSPAEEPAEPESVTIAVAAGQRRETELSFGSVPRGVRSVSRQIVVRDSGAEREELGRLFVSGYDSNPIEDEDAVLDQPPPPDVGSQDE